MKKGKYLITGCAGFIGSNLVKKIYKNYDLILVDDLSEGTVLNLPKQLRKCSSLWFILLNYLAFNEPAMGIYHKNYNLIKHHVVERLVPGEFDDESALQIVEIVERSSNPGIYDTLADLSHTVANKAKEYTKYYF